MLPKLPILSTAALMCGLGAVPELLISQAAAQNATEGSAIFKQRCQVCHTVAPGAKGTSAPNLRGIKGRAAGSAPFNYSQAMKASKIKWDKTTLDQFLAKPTKVVPGTRMVIPTPDAKQRADLIAYLLSLK